MDSWVFSCDVPAASGPSKSTEYAGSSAATQHGMLMLTFSALAD